MPGRYDRSSEFSLDTNALRNSMKPKKRPALREDPLEKMLRIAGGVAPVAGMAIGGLAGMGGGPAGALAGAGLGAGIGQGVGGLANMGAGMMGEGRMAEEERRRREDEEQAAQSNAALRMIQGL